MSLRQQHQHQQQRGVESGSRSARSSASFTTLQNSRSVARPLQNLGSTCFVNCVLQALAHAPELCLAVDAEPHSSMCPIAAENEQAAMASAPESSASDDAALRHTPSANGGSTTPSPSPPEEGTQTALRRSSRGGSSNSRGRRSPSSSNNNNGDSISGSKDHPVAAVSPSAAVTKGNLKFCVLCELEKHLAAVHGNSNSGAVAIAPGAHAPSEFVRGFFEHVAPWFKLGTQEDAHEFLRLLIDAMQKSARNARLQHNPQEDNGGGGGSSRGGSADGKDNDDDNNNDTKDDGRRTEGLSAAGNTSTNTNNTAISKDDTEYPFSLFRGTVESKVVCEACGASSATLDPIEDVGLEVVSSTSDAGSIAASACNHPMSQATSTAPTTRSSSRNASPPVVVGDTAGTVGGQPSAGTLVSGKGGRPLADVTMALQRFARVEVVDGYKCERCGTTGRATKQFRLASVPPILTLHLKRFRYGADAHAASSALGGGNGTALGPGGGGVGGGGSAVATRSSRSGSSGLALGSGFCGATSVGAGMGSQDFVLGGKSGSSKIEGHVGFKDVIDLRPYLTPEVQAATPAGAALCRLFAVVVHAGKNSHSGHYIAYVQSLARQDGWYKMDDGRVSSVEAKDVMKADAYLLFYRVLHHPVTSALKGELMERLSRQAAAADAEQAGSKRRRSSRTAAVLPSAYRDGEEWARAKAPRLLGVASRSQELIAEVLELTQDCLQRIGDEVATSHKDAAQDGRGPATRIAVGENDVVGGVSHVRQKLADLFYRLAQHFDDDEGDAAAPSSNSRPAKALPRRFFVATAGEDKQRASRSSAGAALAKTVGPKSSATVDLTDDPTDLL